MELIFLAKLIGIYLIVIGVIAMARRSSMMPAIAALIKDRALIVLVAFLELAAGIAIVLAEHTIALSWQGIIALVGWLMIVESVLYLSLPYARIQRILKPFNRKEWYLFGGALSVLLGLWLAGAGFGVL